MTGGVVNSKTYGVVAPDILKSYNGLEFLQAMIAGKVPNPPISELLGFHLTEIEKGRGVFEGVPEFHHYNPIGTVHGGFAATLLDSALGCAIFSTRSAIWRAVMRSGLSRRPSATSALRSR